MTISSKQQGALSLFQAFGDEPALARVLDAPVCGEPLAPHALRYGWLRTEAGETIDEVMLACPAAGQRILMTHGGKAVRDQVEKYFEDSRFTPITTGDFSLAAAQDFLLDPLLCKCVTEGQLAAVLAARAEGKEPDAQKILTQRRVVLAGAPNAGKSSLLNALAGYDRAFTDPEAGATRDVVDELIDLSGYAAWLGDMPGFMDEDAEEWRKAIQCIQLSNEIWFIVDASEPWGEAAGAAARAVAEGMKGQGKRVLIVKNKSDRPERLEGAPWKPYFPEAPVVSVNTLPDGNAVEVLEHYVANTWE